MTRVVEVYTGAYASGKSEISINRAFMLNTPDSPITLIDLDTVEPAYTLRPLKKELEEEGLKIVTQEDYFGLGEAGNVITMEQLNCLSIAGNLVIDVGYGVGGLDILEIIQNISDEPDLRIYIVINTSKLETCSKEAIIDYINWSKGEEEQPWKKFSGIISNTHFGDDTSKDDTLRGYEITKEAAKELNLPIIAIAATDAIARTFDGFVHDGVPVWPLTRRMPKALW